MKKIVALCTLILTCVLHLSAQTLKPVDDSQNSGKVEWLNRQVDTGKIPFGIPVTHEFKLKNISKENLMIFQVRTTCHCTSVDWSREPILPGETTVIRATYDAQREGEFYKILAVSTNFDPAQSVPLAIMGKVEKKTAGN